MASSRDLQELKALSAVVWILALFIEEQLVVYLFHIYDVRVLNVDKNNVRHRATVCLSFRLVRSPPHSNLLSATGLLPRRVTVREDIFLALFFRKTSRTVVLEKTRFT